MKSLPVFLFALVLTVLTALAAPAIPAPTGPLGGKTTVQVDPTYVPDPAKIKYSAGPNIAQDDLREAFRSAGFEIGDSTIKAHIVLNEFSSGSTAKRALVGFGAGRSTVTGNLVIQDGEKEIANIRIHVRGSLAWSPYEGDNTQRRQAVSSFQQRLFEEIEKLK